MFKTLIPSFILYQNPDSPYSELIRELLSFADLPFTEISVTGKTNGAPKVLPTLSIDGHLVSGTGPVCRRIADFVGLQGATPREDCIVTSVASQILDLWEEAIVFQLTKKDEEKIGFTLELLTNFVKGAYKGIYVVGKKLTWADILLIHFVRYLIRAVLRSDSRIRNKMLRKTPSRVTDISEVFDSLSLSSKIPLNSEWTDRDRTKTPTSHIGFGPKKDSRALKIRNITPSRNGDFKGVTDGDRYIAQHDQDQLDFARFKMTEESALNTSRSEPSSPTKYAADMLIRHKSNGELNGVPSDGIDMLVWRRNGAPRIAGQKQQNVLYTCMAPSSSVKKDSRVHCKRPVHVLDAPGFPDDFYLNPIDWSSTNVVAIALNQSVCLWNAATGEACEFVDFSDVPGQYVSVCCVKFTGDTRYLAVGLSNGFIHLYDVEKQSLLRKFGTGNWRIAAAAWNKTGCLSFGNRGGALQTHDVRQRHSFLSEQNHHGAEICGLQWIFNDQYLVSGSADSIVNVYDAQQVCRETEVPLFQLNQHLATVKAIAEAPPFVGGNKVLATGGGTNDHCVKFWDLCEDGNLILSYDTGNQVSGINFDPYYREMTTSHGQPKSVVSTWKFNPMASEDQNKFNAVNHIEQTSRVLSMTKSPCGEFVMVGLENSSIIVYDIYKKDETYYKMLSPIRRNREQLKFAGVRQRIR